MGKHPSKARPKQCNDKNLRDVENALGGTARIGAVKAEARVAASNTVAALLKPSRVPAPSDPMDEPHTFKASYPQ
jgi:hypothetical protein